MVAKRKKKDDAPAAAPAGEAPAFGSKRRKAQPPTQEQVAAKADMYMPRETLEGAGEAPAFTSQQAEESVREEQMGQPEPSQPVEDPAPPRKAKTTVVSDDGTAIGGNAGKQLISIVERMERLAEERAGIADDMKDIMAEAKGNGFTVGIIKKVLQRRAMDPEKREEQDAMLELYETVIAGNS